MLMKSPYRTTTPQNMHFFYTIKPKANLHRTMLFSTNSFSLWFNTFTQWSPLNNITFETSTAICELLSAASFVFWLHALGSQHDNASQVNNAPDSHHKKLAKYLTLENHFEVQLQTWGLDLPVDYTFVTHPRKVAHRKDSHNASTNHQHFLDLILSDNHNHIQLRWQLLNVTFTQVIQ